MSRQLSSLLEIQHTELDSLFFLPQWARKGELLSFLNLFMWYNVLILWYKERKVFVSEVCDALGVDVASESLIEPTSNLLFLQFYFKINFLLSFLSYN